MHKVNNNISSRFKFNYMMLNKSNNEASAVNYESNSKFKKFGKFGKSL